MANRRPYFGFYPYVMSLVPDLHLFTAADDITCSAVAHLVHHEHDTTCLTVELDALFLHSLLLRCCLLLCRCCLLLCWSLLCRCFLRCCLLRCFLRGHSESPPFSYRKVSADSPGSRKYTRHCCSRVESHRSVLPTKGSRSMRTCMFNPYLQGRFSRP